MAKYKCVRKCFIPGVGIFRPRDVKEFDTDPGHHWERIGGSDAKTRKVVVDDKKGSGESK